MTKYFIYIQDYYQRIGKLYQGYWIQVTKWKYKISKLKGYKTKKIKEQNITSPDN